MVVSRATVEVGSGHGRVTRRAIVSRATCLAATLLSCRPTPPASTSTPADAHGQHDSAPSTSAATADAHAPRPSRTTPAPLASTVALAYPDAPLSTAQFDQLILQLTATTDPQLAAALVFALARRAPLDRLPRLWTAVHAAQLDTLARGLAGRAPAAAPRQVPPPFISPTRQLQLSAPLATAIQRFHLPLPAPLDPSPYLFAGTQIDQVLGARLLAAPNAPLPPTTALRETTPHAVPALTRSLTQRTNVPPDVLPDLLATVARRAQLAPRVWGNAWRALRDAVPANNPALTAALPALAQSVDQAPTLTGLTAAWWRCENAIAADKALGHLERTLQCADPTHAWVALTAQAQTLAALHGDPAATATQLTTILAAAHGQPPVLAAVASAAAALPPAQARPLLRALANEHDPGVLASTLEALNAHPELAAALPPAARTQLLQSPFDLPEGPALEARIEALHLAHSLHAQSVLTNAPDSSVRAIQLALHPDASVLPDTTPPPSPDAPPVDLRIITDVGVIELELFPGVAPRAVAQIVDAARAHRYDGLTFHRVVPGFVVQGGDPHGDGYGGTENPTPTELSLHPFERGSVGIPLAGLDTGGIQMFIVLADAPHLDARYPWVGRVRRGMDVVDSLLVGDHLQRVEVVARE